MKYKDLRSFIKHLEILGDLRFIKKSVSPHLEMTELCDRVIKSHGPALLFDPPDGYVFPVLCNLFGTPKRIALAMGINVNNNDNIFESLRDVGKFLSAIKDPDPLKSLKDATKLVSLFKSIWDMTPKVISSPPCQEIIKEGNDVDLNIFPIQKCWPEDIAPIITWGLTTTLGLNRSHQNMGIYRQQIIGRNKLIIRWLSHRQSAIDFRNFAKKFTGNPYPIAVSLGADPATLLGTVTPVPNSLSKYQFSGLLRGRRTELANCITPGVDILKVPSSSEIILEGFIYPNKDKSQSPLISDLSNTYPSHISNNEPTTFYEHALEGPHGDHTGYYNNQELFPVFTVEKITMRRNAIYHSTYTGKPPDEPSVLGMALNEVFIPILQKKFDEITDFYLPPEGCSYRIAIVQIKKNYIGQAKRVMFGIWSFLRQFMYTKFIIIVDEDINIRDWKEIIWAITTRVDPIRDTVMIDNTPIDYLDFSSPISGLGSKMGIDATNKWSGETSREWGKPIKMDSNTKNRINDLYQEINIL